MRSVSRLNWELRGVELVGVFLGSKEAAVSDSFSDPEGDGDGALGTWLLPGMKSGSVLPFFSREGNKSRSERVGFCFSAPDVRWESLPKGPWLLVRGSSMTGEVFDFVCPDGDRVIRLGEPSSRATDGEVSSSESSDCCVVERMGLILDFLTCFRALFSRRASSASSFITPLCSLAGCTEFSSPGDILRRTCVSGTRVAPELLTEDRRLASLPDRRDG